ncbi:class I SAM-dependent methyltransferase [Synechococcus sp. BA-120 BA3]|nr:class I SAM-dependent methyltransferase [Synechococcus sp. BA-120 BA3]
MFDNQQEKVSHANSSSSFKTHTSRRVTKLVDILSARTYLEVGVFEGITFNDIRIEKKVAVDPLFRFDTSMHSIVDQVEFVQKPSDQYFLDLASSLKFDIVFLDGLHTYQQTLRDLLNTIAHCHDKSVIIIDDVWPVDIFSSLPQSLDAHEFRRMSGGNSLAWHGDVYKAVFFVHDFIPWLNYCTIENGGNPQTLLWHSPRNSFTPRFNNTEIIERLGYVDLHRNKDIMNFVSESQAFTSVEQALCGT